MVPSVYRLMQIMIISVNVKTDSLENTAEKVHHSDENPLHLYSSLSSLKNSLRAQFVCQNCSPICQSQTGLFCHSRRVPVSLVRFTLVVDKSRNMEHPGTFRNIPEHRIIMIIMRKDWKDQQFGSGSQNHTLLTRSPQSVLWLFTQLKKS